MSTGSLSASVTTTTARWRLSGAKKFNVGMATSAVRFVPVRPAPTGMGWPGRIVRVIVLLKAARSGDGKRCGSTRSFTDAMPTGTPGSSARTSSAARRARAIRVPRRERSRPASTDWCPRRSTRRRQCEPGRRLGSAGQAAPRRRRAARRRARRPPRERRTWAESRAAPARRRCLVAYAPRRVPEGERRAEEPARRARSGRSVGVSRSMRSISVATAHVARCRLRGRSRRSRRSTPTRSPSGPGS